MILYILTKLHKKMNSIEMIRLAYLSFSIIGPLTVGVYAPIIKKKVIKKFKKSLFKRHPQLQS